MNTWIKGSDYGSNDNGFYVAGINVGEQENAIECTGETAEIAQERRDCILQQADELASAYKAIARLTEWRHAIFDACTIIHYDVSGVEPDPRKVINNMVNAYTMIALDPKVSEEAQALVDSGFGGGYQRSVLKWTEQCFGTVAAYDAVERNHRFLEEALELVQAGGCSKEDAYALVDYVYSRPVGELKQEVGGVMTTLAALCNAHHISMIGAGKDALIENWQKIDRIREKRNNKPVSGPLPGTVPVKRVDNVFKAIDNEYDERSLKDISTLPPTTAEEHRERNERRTHNRRSNEDRRIEKELDK